MSDSARYTIEQFLLLQSQRQWSAALELLSDKYLAKKYGPIHEACTPESAQKYGYQSVTDALDDSLRSFVRRMLESSERDADGANPVQDAIPHNADCHMTFNGDEVIVTLSTPYASSRIRYQTERMHEGRRLITAATVAHNHGFHD